MFAINYGDREEVIRRCQWAKMSREQTDEQLLRMGRRRFDYNKIIKPAIIKSAKLSEDVL